MTSWALRAVSILVTSMVLSCPAWADEVQLRKNLLERFASKISSIDEVKKTPVPGLYEVRIGSNIFYSDEDGHHIIEGQMIDTEAGVNLTEVRISGLTAFDFAKLPFKDAVVWKSGNGAQRLAVFSDPHCTYCKGLEVELQKLKNVTVYTFLIPVLGPESDEKAKNIWCAKNKTDTWLGWMLKNQVPGAADASCDASAIERNLTLAQKHRVKGTPAIVFSDNSRVPGAMSAAEIEKRLSTLKKS
jgi:thiol:disulfide interchange protein DsbC